MMMRRISQPARSHARFIAACTMLLILCLAAPLSAQQTPVKPEISGAQMQDYGRILFRWPEAVSLDASSEGNRLTLNFDKPVNASAMALTQSLSGYVTGGQLSADGRQLTLSLTQAYAIRSFNGDKMNGVDLLGNPIQKASKEAGRKADPAPIETVESETIPPRDDMPPPRIMSSPEDGTAPIPLLPPDTSATAQSSAPAPLISDIFADTPEGSTILPIQLSQTDDGAEIRFKWDKSVGYRSFQRTDRMLIDFDETAPTVPPSVDASLKPYITSVGSRTMDGHLMATIMFPQGIKASHRRDGNHVVVTLQAEDNAPVEATQTAAASPAPEPVKKKEKAQAPDPTPATTPPAPSPTAKPETKKPSQPTVPASKPVKESAAPAKAQKVQKTAIASPRFKPTNIPTPKTPAKQPLSAPVTSPPAQQVAAPGSSPTIGIDYKKQQTQPIRRSEALRPIQTNKDDSTQITFPWEAASAAAAFTRHGTSWVVFDLPSKLNSSALSKPGKAPISYQDKVPHEHYTILRFSNPKSLPILMQRSGTQWTLTAAEELPEKHKPIRVELRTPEGGRPHLFIPMIRFADPVMITDPDIGDSLTFIPVALPGYAMYPTRRFVELDLPASEQGAVVISHSDNVTLQPLRSGVRISSPFGLQISPDLPLPAGIHHDDYLETGTVFPHARWRVPDGSNLMAERRALEQDIATERMGDEDMGYNPNPFRLRLAQLYLTEDMPEEALALLKMIEQDDAAYAKSARVPLLRGIAHFMMEEFEEARDTFLDPPLKEYPETDFWLKMTRVALDDWKAPLTLSPKEKGYLRGYSPGMRRDIAFIMAEKYIADKNYKRAVTSIDDLRLEGELDGLENRAQTLFGEIAAESGRYESAIGMWEPLTDQLQDPYARFHAGLGLARLLHQTKAITPEETIERLEKLRYVWRGDESEQELLRMLGQLYVDTGQFEEGLAVWKELVTYYPETDTSKKVAQQMTDIFIQLFNRGGADNLSPLKALSLYYHYPELLPLGPEGDAIVQKLADRLVDIDLLTRGAQLLTHQVKYRLSGVERARVGARLAAIHLMNRAPELAIQAIDTTAHPGTSRTLDKTRRHLLAQALLETADYTRALSQVAKDRTEQGEQLAIEILWAMEQWGVTGDFLRRVLSETPPGSPPSDRDAQRILRLALANLYADNATALKRTRNDYKDIMEESDYADAFTFLTTRLSTINHKTINKVQAIIERFQSFMDGFSKKIRDEGLSEVIE